MHLGNSKIVELVQRVQQQRALRPPIEPGLRLGPSYAPPVVIDYAQPTPTVPGRLVEPRQVTRSRGKRGFVLWLRQAMPDVYRRVRERAPELLTQSSTGMAAMGPMQTVALPSEQPASKSWIDKLLAVATPAISLYQQKKLLDLQIERARAGLEPLDITEYGTPAAAVEIQVAKQTRTTAMLIGGAVLVGVVVLAVAGSRRR